MLLGGSQVKIICYAVAACQAYLSAWDLSMVTAVKSRCSPYRTGFSVSSGRIETAGC